jgi:molybdenum cofactor cytidylyltransferase
MITLATVPEWQRMEACGMVATIKIISYAVPSDGLARACALGAKSLWLCPPTRPRVRLIQTAVGAEDGEKGHRVTEARVARLGGALAPKHLVPHRTDDLAAAIRAVRHADVILILTGSATSDMRDTAPQALRQAGGKVVHFGMPVDPGNLLFIGRLGRVPVIGLPGCAKSPALNGADWVLERVMCGIPVTARSIAAMGVGGLLKEIPSRPRPRA